jgi:hypothetical protein
MLIRENNNIMAFFIPTFTIKTSTFNFHSDLSFERLHEPWRCIYSLWPKTLHWVHNRANLQISEFPNLKTNQFCILNFKNIRLFGIYIIVLIRTKLCCKEARADRADQFYLNIYDLAKSSVLMDSDTRVTTCKVQSHDSNFESVIQRDFKQWCHEFIHWINLLERGTCGRYQVIQNLPYNILTVNH